MMFSSNSILLECKTDLLSTFRSKSFVIPATLFPCLFYLFFGIVFSPGEAQSYMFINYLIFGMIGPALFSFGVNVAMEKQNGWLTLKQLAPVSPYQYLIAKCASAISFSLIVAVLMSGLALIAGVNLSLAQWLMVVAIALIGTLPLCVLGLLLGMSVSAKAAPAIVNLVYLPLSLLSGLWLPIHLFPEVMQWCAWLLPSFHISQLALKAIDASLGYIWWQHFLVLLFQTLAMMVIAKGKFQS